MKKIFLLGAFALGSISIFANNGIKKDNLKTNSNYTKKATFTTNISNKIENANNYAICTITITQTNSFGMIVNQWQESYIVADWDIAGCNAIGRKRVSQLNGGN